MCVYTHDLSLYQQENRGEMEKEHAVSNDNS